LSNILNFCKNKFCVANEQTLNLYAEISFINKDVKSLQNQIAHLENNGYCTANATELYLKLRRELLV